MLKIKDNQRRNLQCKWQSGSWWVYIKEQRLNATSYYWEGFQWIPYENFSVKQIAEGGFGKVYKAWWSRTGKLVALKVLNESQGVSVEKFLQEVNYYRLFHKITQIVKCFGISRDTNGNYLMVMYHVKDGNLRQFLQEHYSKLNFAGKLAQLWKIVNGLKEIHKQGLVHKDFHTGNILNRVKSNQAKKINNATYCYITDLGLCRPVDETNQEKVYGVMPYVAPEVLQNQPYTQAADIYSFGIIAYEMLIGLPPYYDRNHDASLGFNVCQGLRPQFNIKIPPLLEDLIKRCWDANPSKRPTANELERTLREWQGELNSYRVTEFETQLQTAEEHNKTLPDHIKYPDYKKKTHAGAVYHSKLLPTKEITRLLQTSQTLCQPTQEFTGSSTIDMGDMLNNLTNLEDKQSEQEAKIIHNPPKNN